jgi:ferredoxin
MWRVTVSHDCIGAGVCVGTAPRHFALGTDERSHPLTSPVEPDEAVLDAAASCPVEAIEVTDAGTGEAVEW